MRRRPNSARERSRVPIWEMTRIESASVEENAPALLAIDVPVRISQLAQG